MKTLLLFGALALSINVFGQSSCFSDKSDVMTYVIYKTFESEDGNIKIEFGTSKATLTAGSNTSYYMYDQFSYMGSGYKGSITMSSLSGDGGLKMYVSCKEQMMTDNKGTLLYEEGTNSSSNSSSSNSSSVNSVKIGNLEVMTEDLGTMNWEDAKKACADLGDGWRLPTKDELNVLYQNMDKIGGFAGSYYWSSTQRDKNLYFAWRQFFFTGSQHAQLKDWVNYVRAVRAF